MTHYLLSIHGSDGPFMEDTDWSQIIALYDQLLAVSLASTTAEREFLRRQVQEPTIASSRQHFGRGCIPTPDGSRS